MSKRFLLGDKKMDGMMIIPVGFGQSNVVSRADADCVAIFGNQLLMMMMEGRWVIFYILHAHTVTKKKVNHCGNWASIIAGKNKSMA